MLILYLILILMLTLTLTLKLSLILPPTLTPTERAPAIPADPSQKELLRRSG